jgi:hypothetical protein
MTKRLTSSLAAVVMLASGVALTSAFAGGAASASPASPLAPAGIQHHGQDRRFEELLRRYEAANSAFLNGDPGPWLSITAENDPASIFGGFGGLGEAGVDDVHQRYLLAAGAFQPSGAKVDIDYLVKDVQGRIAYTVAIERSRVRYTGKTEVQDQVLRVTMIFRLERGQWRIVHRHADDMIDLQLPQP